MKQISIIFLVSLILFSSCATTRVGHNINRCETTNDLRRTFGPPDNIMNNGSAGEIWLYSETWVKSTPGKMTVENNTATWSNPSELAYEKYIKFWIEGDKIYRWESSGHKLKKMTPIGAVGLIGGAFFFGYSILGPALNP
jgi:hypothetical protein